MEMDKEPTPKEGREGACWSLEEREVQESARGCHMGNGAGKDTADVGGRELTTGMGDKRESSQCETLQSEPPESRRPLPMCL